MADPLSTWRERFPILAKKTYLANHTLGAMPASVNEAFAEYTALWAEEGVVAWDTWQPLVSEVAGILEAIIHAPRGSMTMAQNATNALAMLLSCIEYEHPRTRIIHAAAEFPTVEYLLDGQRRLGAEVVRAGSDPLVYPAEEILAAIDERTALVVVSHVAFRTSELVDVARIVAKAHLFGAMVVLDAYQSMGAVPFDVAALGVDALIGGSVKWLCGGPGAGYLYVNPAVLERMQPYFTGWFSHARPFAFEPPPIEHAPGIERFTGGTPNIPAYYQAREGYRIIRDVGVGAIRAKSERQTEILRAGANERGWRVNSPAVVARRGNHLTIDFPGAEDAKLELIRRGFVVDFRPGAGIRLGPHFFTTDDECRAVLAELDRILRG